MTDAPPPWCAVVLNPAKAGQEAENVVHAVAAAADRRGWAPPKVWHTTPADSGAGQAREALLAGASLVVAAGGDGTVRSVAGVLAGTEVPMGLVPVGTTNLLARNIGIPLDPVSAARVATTGATREMDVCRARVMRPSGLVSHETSVVMLGMGLDAQVVEDLDDDLKQQLGWAAYVAAGLRRLRGERYRVRLWLDAAAPVVMHVKSVLVANAGELTGGARLVPEARLDDGVAEVVTVNPRGLAGWPSVIWWAARGARRDHPMVRRVPVHQVRLDARWPMPAQVDGDALGEVIRMDVTVHPRALLVRVP